MKKSVLVVLAGVISYSCIIQAATITPKSGVSILYVNGQASEEKMGVNQLEEGFNQVVVRMDKNMSRGSSSDVFTSKPYVLSFEDVQGDLEIDHPIARSKMEAEKVFESNDPQWVLEENGKAISYQQEVLEGKSGLFPYLGMDKLIAEHNQSRGIFFNDGQLVDKPVAVQAAVTTSTTTAGSKAVEKAVVTSNVEQLKAWYLQSSQEERKAFRKWIIDQE